MASLRGADGREDQPTDPILSMVTQFLPLGSGQPGDFVYSQEALDRIITQLMEQTATSSAPGPAPQSEIDSLPRKEVTVEMLGNEGRAGCSICMDEVNIGEQVAELPCRHWFHHACVAAWLAEHDTCPHCRKGTSKHNSEASQADTSSTSAGPSHQIPGSFVSGEETYPDPFIVRHSTGPQQNQPELRSEASGEGDSAGSSERNREGDLGGFSERIRRGLFGPPR